MNSERPNNVLQQIPLTLKQNSLTNNKAITLPFEYQQIIPYRKIDSGDYQKKLDSLQLELEGFKTELEEKSLQLQQKREIFNTWKNSTVNKLAPGYLDNTEHILKPKER
ncbi:hypothetical protein PACTADRAFT_34783 [Pachysolen tannophilus NRRL Y-2460]|uniref:Uncharacterized protein n=1 Tax=Pachysolen tannophilus NRRL Y-2460 TaxID=669874 RepID=A0A1E4TTD0_PACTA|nr:hypothetical protein PACTADRAFT_34783 [Pachysolen tannophilus NRRL Y-2460]